MNLRYRINVNNSIRIEQYKDIFEQIQVDKPIFVSKRYYLNTN